MLFVALSILQISFEVDNVMSIPLSLRLCENHLSDIQEADTRLVSKIEKASSKLSQYVESLVEVHSTYSVVYLHLVV